jgi:RNase H-fold protein (predicted Holliday junction resolvase)
MQVFKTPPLFVDGAKLLLDIAQQHCCDGIVVGVPLTPRQHLWDSNQDSRIGRRCRNFAHTVAMLAKPLDLHVFIVSERYSTAEATHVLENNKRRRRKIKVRCYTVLRLNDYKPFCRCLMDSCTYAATVCRKA